MLDSFRWLGRTRHAEPNGWGGLGPWLGGLAIKLIQSWFHGIQKVNLSMEYKPGKSTDHDQNLMSYEDGQETSAH